MKCSEGHVFDDSGDNCPDCCIGYGERTERDRCAQLVEDVGCSHNGCSDKFGHDSLCHKSPDLSISWARASMESSVTIPVTPSEISAQKSVRLIVEFKVNGPVFAPREPKAGDL